MGDPASFARDLFHARHRGGGNRIVPPSRAQRGSGLHRQDHGRAGRVARGHGQRHAPADHRPPRAQARGDAEPGLPEELHDRRPGHGLRQPEGLDACGSGPGHLVSGAQEGRRHPRLPAAGHRRPGLQRRVRRHLRHRLRLHRRWVHPSGAEGHRGRRPQAAPRAAGHHEDRRPRGPGRARLCGVLDRAARWPRDRPRRADRRPRGPERRHASGRGADRRTKKSSSASRARSGRSGTSSASISSRTAG